MEGGPRTAMKSGPRTAMKSGPRLPQLERALARTEDPTQPKIKIEPPYDLAIPLLGIYLKKMKT